MTAQEKAKYLVNKFSVYDFNTSTGWSFNEQNSKQTAKNVVDEIVNASPTNPLTGGYIELYSDMVDEAILFWKEVKEEIEKWTPAP